MCGPTAAQNELSQEQGDFYKTLTQAYSTQFAESQGIVNSLTSTFTPILNAGPNQEGFSTAEKNAMNTEATEGTANDYAHAQTATQQALAARGGGNTFLPSGGDAQLTAENANAAAGEQATAKQNITTEDYDAGRQNWQLAAQELGSTAGLVSPSSAASSATGAGSAAGTTDNQIAQEQASGWQMAAGALGGIAGNLTYSGGAGFGLGKG